jgi:hypothetical protein
MVKKHPVSSVLNAWLLAAALLFLAACSGTLEIGVVHTSTPGSTATSVEVSSATPTAVSPSESTPTPISGPSVLHVAFVKDGNIWLWREGEEVVSLTRAGAFTDPRISDDGEIVAFTRGEELWAVNSDGTDERPLVTRENLGAMEPTDPGPQRRPTPGQRRHPGTDRPAPARRGWRVHLLARWPPGCRRDPREHQPGQRRRQQPQGCAHIYTHSHGQ